MHRIILLITLLLFALPALAVESPTLELGKTLFESPELSSNQRSCSTCHANGKGLDLVGDFDDMQLKEIINACIRDALRGQMISLESQEMDALLGYVRLFQKDDK